jgi:hypothetical protein
MRFWRWGGALQMLEREGGDNDLALTDIERPPGGGGERYSTVTDLARFLG